MYIADLADEKDMIPRLRGKTRLRAKIAAAD